MQMTSEASILFEGRSQVSVVSELDDIDSLVSLYRARLRRYVMAAVRDEDLADTILQDCFLKAYAYRASFRGECAVSTWLFSIANNLIRDHLRTKKFQFWKRAAETAKDVVEMASFLPSGECSPEERLLNQERVRQVGEALGKLSVNQRKVFALRFSEDLDLAEIAQVTGMQITTVKTHLHRAVVAIRANVGGKK